MLNGNDITGHLISNNDRIMVTLTSFNVLPEHVILTAEWRVEESLNDILLSTMHPRRDSLSSTIPTATLMETFPWLLSSDNVGDVT